MCKTGAANSSSTANILTSYTRVVIQRVYCGTATLLPLGHSLNPSHYLNFQSAKYISFFKVQTCCVFV